MNGGPYGRLIGGFGTLAILLTTAWLGFSYQLSTLLALMGVVVATVALSNWTKRS